MITIYKYPIGKVSMPKGAKVLTVDVKVGEFYLWAEVDTDAPLEEREFHVYGTGYPLPDNRCYIATVFENVFVWHVYEVV